VPLTRLPWTASTPHPAIDDQIDRLKVESIRYRSRRIPNRSIDYEPWWLARSRLELTIAYKMPRPRITMTVILVCFVLLTFHNKRIGSRACPTRCWPSTVIRNLKKLVRQDSHNTECVLFRSNTMSMSNSVITLPRHRITSTIRSTWDIER
jgi:hypothetical protein